jgi:hypothetical protein
MSLNERTPVRPIVERAKNEDANAEFGSLDDMCMAHVPGDRRELLGECGTLYPDDKKKPETPADSLDWLSLSKKR